MARDILIHFTSAAQCNHNMFAVAFRGHRSATRVDLIRQAAMLRGRRPPRWPSDHDEVEHQESGQKAAACRFDQRVNEATGIAPTIDTIGGVGRTHRSIPH